MNTSEDEVYSEYDYNSTCEEDEGPGLPDGSTVMLVLYYTVFCLSLIGNSTVLWVLLRYIKLKTMTDVCLLNLALSDLILAVTLPLWAYNDPNLASCKLMTGGYQLGFYSGTLFVTLMSVDRYLAIVHAVAAMRARTLRYGVIASVAIWVVSLVMALPGVAFASLETNEDDDGGGSGSGSGSGSHSECQPLYPEDRQRFWKVLRNVSENTVGLFLCLPVMVFCYVKILAVLSRSRNAKKDRAVRLIFTVVCVFAVCWVPYNVTVLLQTLQLYLDALDTCDASRGINSAMHFAEVIALAHCCVNPVIYAFVGEKFRKSLGKVLTRPLCWSPESRGAFSGRDTTEKETSNTPVKSDY